jgi:hypothetical protein
MVEEWSATFPAVCRVSCPGTTVSTSRRLTATLPLLHNQLGSPVLRPAFLGFVGSNGLLLTVAVSADAILGDSSRHHYFPHGDRRTSRTTRCVCRT